MRKPAVIAVLVGALLASTVPASASTETPVADLSVVPGLTAEQRAAIASFNDRATVGSPAAATGAASGAVVATANSSRRATFYRGSALMWTRDNVDFGYNWSRVTWTSPFQQRGWIWPNIARNRGIAKYLDTTKTDRFRARNTIGAGVPTPWGDVKVYSSDYVHRLSVNHNGAWSAWSD